MGNLINLPNINPDSIVFDNEQEKKQNTSSFDTKNYLNLKLNEGEDEKTVSIRLLPMDLSTGNPFQKVYVHNVRVNPKLVKPGDKPFKSFICLHKNKDIDHEKFGDKCPYCEMNYAAYLEAQKTNDPVAKKSFTKMSFDNLAKEAMICRCIERGKEDEGVKFWKFNIRLDKTDPYNQILKLYTLRKESAQRKGKDENILDIYNGRDLNITVTADGTSAPSVVDDSDRSPLSDNEELMKEWIYDKKTWKDVFTCKPYDYLNIASQMKVPWFDRNTNTWICKEDYEKKEQQKQDDATNTIQNATNEVMKMATEQVSNQQYNTNNHVTENLVQSLEIQDGELPF